MSKITNDGLTRSGTGCFTAVLIYGNSGRQRDISQHVFTTEYDTHKNVSCDRNFTPVRLWDTNFGFWRFSIMTTYLLWLFQSVMDVVSVLSLQT